SAEGRGRRASAQASGFDPPWQTLVFRLASRRARENNGGLVGIGLNRGENQMNQVEFEARLKADGFTEIATQDLQPRAPRGEHGHPFAVRGLVLAGAFIVSRDGRR